MTLRGWERGRLKWDASLVAGATPSTDEASYWLDGDDPMGTPFVAIGDMSRRRAVTHTAKRVSHDGLQSRNMPVGRPGTILLAMYASVGEVSRLDIDATWNQAILGIEPDTSRVDPRFLVYYLLAARDALLSDVRSNTQSNLNAGQIGDLWYLRPSVREQVAIADFLDRETAQIDTLIAKQEQLIETLRERKRAVAESAVATVSVAGPRLKHFVTSVTQGWSPQCLGWPADGVGTWAVLKAGAANGGVFRPYENKELPPEEEPRPDITVRAGQLIVSRANTRDLVGSAAVSGSDYPRLMLCDKLYAFDLDICRAEPRFVALTLGSRRWRDLVEMQATGASHSMVNVSQSDIVNLPMGIPSLDDQRRILDRCSAVISEIDALIAKAEQFVALVKERRAALITSAVTGQIDVTRAA